MRINTNKKLFTPLLLITLILGLLPINASAQTTFKDYLPSDFGYSSVIELSKKGIVTGYPDNTFQPKSQLNRAQAAVMFQRAFDLPTPAITTSFTDVKQGLYYTGAASATKEAGIFRGNANGTFGPNDLLTREQMASVLVRAFQLKAKTNVNVVINDLDKISPIHVSDVRVLYQNAITAGKDGGMFDPKGPVTRAEFSVFLHRAIVTIGIPSQSTEDKDKVTDPVQPNPNPGPTPEPEEPVNIDVTKASLTTTQNKTIEGSISSGNKSTTITFDLTGQPDKETLKSGRVSVNEDGTMTITYLPVIGGGQSQTLKSGDNPLAIANKIAEHGITFELLRLFGNFEVEAELVDKENNKRNITLVFKVK